MPFPFANIACHGTPIRVPHAAGLTAQVVISSLHSVTTLQLIESKFERAFGDDCLFLRKASSVSCHTSSAYGGCQLSRLDAFCIFHLNMKQCLIDMLAASTTLISYSLCLARYKALPHKDGHPGSAFHHIKCVIVM